MPHAETSQALEQQRARLRDQLASIGDLRPGSLVGRYRKCGKPGCHCAQPEAAGHGPSWSLTRAVRGKTVTQVIPAGPALVRTQAHIAEYRRFRQLIQAFIEVSTRLCDAQLATPTPAPAGAEKRGSPPLCRPRSSRKSRRSPA